MALAQVNPTVGAIEANARLVIDWMDRARAAGADVVAFPELVLTGYPPEDLVFKPSFIETNLRALADVAAHSRGLTAVVGFVDKRDDIFNAAAVLHDGAHGGDLSQAVPAELRGLRREPLLPGRHGQPDLHPGRRGPRHQHLRGHLVSHRAHHRAGPGRRGAGREHQRVTLPRRQGAVPREDAGDARRRRPRVPGLRQHGGRAGRARLRRPVLHLQREGRAGRDAGAPSRKTSSSPTSSWTTSSARACTTRAAGRRSCGATARRAGSPCRRWPRASGPPFRPARRWRWDASRRSIAPSWSG